jgi:hypothetical protein
MWFIFSTLVLIGHLWQPKAAVFLHISNQSKCGPTPVCVIKKKFLGDGEVRFKKVRFNSLNLVYIYGL